MTRATLDVNVLLSALIGPMGSPRLVVGAWQAGRFTHVTSDAIISTFEDKLRDLELVRRFPFLPAAGGAFLPLLRTQATVMPLPATAISPITGDPEDDAVLATARLGQVDYLVTGDRGLLALGNHSGVGIIRPRDLLIALSQ